MATKSRNPDHHIALAGALNGHLLGRIVRAGEVELTFRGYSSQEPTVTLHASRGHIETLAHMIDRGRGSLQLKALVRAVRILSVEERTYPFPGHEGDLEIIYSKGRRRRQGMASIIERGSVVQSVSIRWFDRPRLEAWLRAIPNTQKEARHGRSPV